MRAITVCSGYADYLAITLPRNRHHFEDFLIVTSGNDIETHRLAVKHNCRLFLTDDFWKDGAKFNKFLCLESGLDYFGREDWITILDADVIIPRDAKIEYELGYLYTPLRRMMIEMDKPIPAEECWNRFVLSPNTREWTGFMQTFHGLDPVLGKGPWHMLNQPNAGVADSYFQARWPQEKKRRPAFEVLHLGPNRVNWNGRVSQSVAVQ